METPPHHPPSQSRQRSTSRTRRAPPIRPTTPLRAPSRTSLRASTTTPQTTQSKPSSSYTPTRFPLETLEPGFAELSDSMADLEANMMHLQLLHESVSRFNENFAAFLYGLNMSAFCVDFPEAPGVENFRRGRERQQSRPQQSYPSQTAGSVRHGGGLGVPDTARGDVDATFLTTDTSFVENPPGSTRPASKFTDEVRQASASSKTSGVPRGGAARGRGIPVRGTRASAARGSGIGRGTSRGIR